jgi:hypothetical protein
MTAKNGSTILLNALSGPCLRRRTTHVA